MNTKPRPVVAPERLSHPMFSSFLFATNGRGFVLSAHAYAT